MWAGEGVGEGVIGADGVAASGRSQALRAREKDRRQKSNFVFFICKAKASV